jgi:Raf kinase inhibitor-like YbhB/YbcL family protein
MSLEVSSSAFREGEAIPKQYTGDGKNISPPIRWEGGPSNTRSYALICEDPDAPAGIWTHWIVFNIPSDKDGLDEALPSRDLFPDGTKQGRNDFGKIGYGGPAPPKGKPHRYFFKLYALDTQLDLLAGSTRAQFLKVIQGRVLAEGQLMATYARG